MSKLFSSILVALKDFTPAEGLNSEAGFEKKLRTYLESKGFVVSSQVSKKKDRYDLLCRDGNQLVCVEMKKKAEISDIQQFDRYLPKFKDGFIVVCWQATFSVREIFAKVVDQSPIPIALIELSEKYGLV